LTITFSGIGPEFTVTDNRSAPIRFAVNPASIARDLAPCTIPAGADVVIEGGSAAMVQLLPEFHPDAAAQEEMYADPGGFRMDLPEYSCGEEPRITINGDEWLWAFAHTDADEETWMPVPASMRWAAAFRLDVGPYGDPGHFAVVHDPRASITWEGDSATSRYAVVYGRELADVIRDLVDVDYDWLADQLAPWCPFCDVEEYWAADVLIPEVFTVKFADDVSSPIVADFLSKYWRPCADHSMEETAIGGRQWRFDDTTWTTRGDED